MRVRASADGAVITIKVSRHGLTPSEFEYPIPLDDAKCFIAKRGGFGLSDSSVVGKPGDADAVPDGELYVTHISELVAFKTLSIGLMSDMSRKDRSRLAVLYVSSFVQDRRWTDEEAVQTA